MLPDTRFIVLCMQQKDKEKVYTVFTSQRRGYSHEEEGDWKFHLLWTNLQKTTQLISNIFMHHNM